MATKQSSKQTASNLKMVSWLLRIGLASVLVYAGVGALRQPEVWVGFIPSYLTSFIFQARLLLQVVSIIQIGVAVWLLSGRYVRYAALVAAALLGGIIVFNLNALLITFRDIGLVFMALALAVLNE